MQLRKQSTVGSNSSPVSSGVQERKGKMSVYGRIRAHNSGLAALILVLIGGGLLSYVHNFVIPLPMALNVFSAYDSDKDLWEYKIEKENLGDLGEQHEEWSSEKGLGYESSRFWQNDLWENWRTYILMGVIWCSFLAAYGIRYGLHLGTNEPEEPLSTENNKPAEGISKKPEIGKNRKGPSPRCGSELSIIIAVCSRLWESLGRKQLRFRVSVRTVAQKRHRKSAPVARRAAAVRKP